jgi:hypothetical protein
MFRGNKKFDCSNCRNIGNLSKHGNQGDQKTNGKVSNTKRNHMISDNEAAMVTSGTKAVINVRRSFCKMSRYFCQILTKIVTCQQILVQTPNTNYHPNLPDWSCSIMCGQTDGETSRR